MDSGACTQLIYILLHRKRQTRTQVRVCTRAHDWRTRLTHTTPCMHPDCLPCSVLFRLSWQQCDWRDHSSARVNWRLDFFSLNPHLGVRGDSRRRIMYSHTHKLRCRDCVVFAACSDSLVHPSSRPSLLVSFTHSPIPSRIAWFAASTSCAHTLRLFVFVARQSLACSFRSLCSAPPCFLRSLTNASLCKGKTACSLSTVTRTHAYTHCYCRRVHEGRSACHAALPSFVPCSR